MLKMMIVLNYSSKFLNQGEINLFDHTSKISTKKLRNIWHSKSLITKEVNEQITSIISKRSKLSKDTQNQHCTTTNFSIIKSQQSN